MKKIFTFILVLIMLFVFVACNNGSDSVNKTNNESNKETNSESNDGAVIDIWNGVEGNEKEFTLTMAGSTLNMVLNRDGSCYMYSNYGNVIDGNDVGHPEFDAEMKILRTNYGTFDLKSGNITFTISAQLYYCFVATGNDANALKDAYFESKLSEADRDGYYGKGLIKNEHKGTNILVCNFDGDKCVVSSATVYDENNVKLSVSVVNPDSSYINTSFYSDGTTFEIREYDSNDSLLKVEHYAESGVLEYIETIVREDGHSVNTRTDADGNVIRSEEYKNKNYENGGTYRETTTIENGIMIYHNIVVDKLDANGNLQTNYLLVEQRDGNKQVYTVSYTDYKDSTNNYTLSKETVDGTLSYYCCEIGRVTVIEGVTRGRQSVTYNSEENKYSLNYEICDEHGIIESKGFDYPADEYTHGEWEKFEYVIE